METKGDSSATTALTFKAPLDDLGFETLNAGDVLKGGTSTDDTLFIGSGAGAENFAQATITGVEKVVLNGGAIDVSQNLDVKSVSVNATAAGTASDVLKVRTEQTVTLNSIADTAGTGVITYTDATGSADAATVALNNVTLAKLTNTGIEKATFLATGKNDLGTIDNAALGDLTFSGAGSVKATLVDLTAGVKTIDASGLDGGLTLGLANGDLDAKSVVTGSAKGRDTLVFSGAVAAGSGDAANYLTFEHVTGFEVLEVGTGALTVDRSLDYMKQFDTFAVAGTGAMDISGAVGKNTFIFRGGTPNATSSVDMVNSEAGKLINVNLMGDASLANTSMLKTDATNILLTSEGGTANTFKLADLGGTNITAGAKVTLAGDTELTLTFGAGAAKTIGITVDGTSFDGKLTATGGAGEDTLIGGDGVNVLTGGDGVDIIIGGAGANTLDGGAGADVITGGKGTNTITGGNGIDKIDISLGGDDSINLKTIDDATNHDVVTGFTAGKVVAGNGADIVKLDGSGATATTHTIQEIKIAPTTDIAFDTTQASGKSILELAFDLAGNDVTGKDLDASTDGTALLAALGQKISVTADTNKGYILAYQGGNAYLYQATDGAATGSTLADTNVVLIGVFNTIEVGAFDAGNFNFS